MSSINPFSGYVAAGGQVERAQAADKVRQIRRQQQLARNVAARDDVLEHQVESPDTVTGAIGEQPPRQDQPRKQKREDEGDDDDQPHVDVTA